MGRSRDDLRPGLRSFAVGQYVIVYTIEDEDVEICTCFTATKTSKGCLGNKGTKLKRSE